MFNKLLIRLEPDIESELENLAKEEHTTKAQLIRDAVKSFLVRKKTETVKVNDELLKYAGIFKGTEMEVDGLEYQLKIREEWERDL